MGVFKIVSSGRWQRCVTYGRILNRTCSSKVAAAEDNLKDKSEKSETDVPVDGGKRGLVLGVYESDNKFELTPAAAEADQQSGGKLCRHLSELSCEMKLGKAFVVTELLPSYSSVALASYGPKDAGYNKLEELDEAKENTRWGVGAGVAALVARGCGAVHVDGGTAPAAAAEAAHLASWRFEEFKTSPARPAPSVSEYAPPGVVGSGDAGGAGETWRAGAVRGAAQNWARRLSDMPANTMAPVDFAQATLDTLCPLGIKVDARDHDWIKAQKMEAFLAVARGSCETPIFLECVYSGGGKQAPVLLAAKGVTFDSGGLCLKRATSMVENRGSMAGAAVAVSALKALAELKVPINVACVIPLCENMVSGQCMKVGDMVRALNGLSIQIEDTDMEGRLMMADALVYGQVMHKPSLVIDVATLTHGVLLATGGGAFGCFSNSAALWRAVRQAGATTGDRGWRFPLWHYYHQQITNDMAVDLRNKGSGRATPCLGAAFLRNFICTDWVHMDITGVGKLGHAPAPPYLHPRRMTGRPARTLATLLARLAERDGAPRESERGAAKCH